MRVRQNSKTARGFTLVEVMVVTAVLGVLTAIAVPTMIRARENAHVGSFVANLRSASGAFFQYYAAEGEFPPTTAAGSVPAGMNDYLTRFPWTSETDIGGQWAWDNNVNGYKAGLVVVNPSAPLLRQQSADEKIDDGSLATGQFRSRPGGLVLVMDE